MKIGILGSGTVAQSLAAGLQRHGHQVMLGSSTPEKLADWVAQHPGARSGSFADASAHGELVILAVKGTASESVIRALDSSLLQGKTVIDATNPLADAAPVNGVLSAFTGPNESLMERLQAIVPSAHFVKAFSSVGQAHFIDPAFVGGPPTMFICGNDDNAKKEVSTLLAQVGWDSVDMGRVEAARAIEPLAVLWCIPGLLRNEWSHAFKLLR